VSGVATLLHNFFLQLMLINYGKSDDAAVAANVHVLQKSFAQSPPSLSALRTPKTALFLLLSVIILCSPEFRTISRLHQISYCRW